jgi:hypothetical protein
MTLKQARNLKVGDKITLKKFGPKNKLGNEWLLGKWSGKELTVFIISPLSNETIREDGCCFVQTIHDGLHLWIPHQLIKPK